MAFNDILQQYRGMYDQLQQDEIKTQKTEMTSYDSPMLAEEANTLTRAQQESQDELDWISNIQIEDQERNNSGEPSASELEEFKKGLDNDPYFKKYGKELFSFIENLKVQMDDPTDPMDAETAQELYIQHLEGMESKYKGGK